jgi:hypothetical protein
MLSWRRPVVAICSAAFLLAGSRAPAARAERAPTFEGAVIFPGGETHLVLTDELAKVPLPEKFEGWTCYVDGTQRNGPVYFKTITCGGKWGFVDAFVLCGPKRRNASAQLRLRRPGTHDTANSVTIGVTCGY